MRRVERLVDDLARAFGDTEVARPCIGAQGAESRVGIGVPAFGQDALDLLDEDACGQGTLQLGLLDLLLPEIALLEECDGRDVGERLGQGYVLWRQRLRTGVEQVQRAHGTVPQPERNDMTGMEATAPGMIGESRPSGSVRGIVEVDVDAGGAGAVAVDTGALVVLQGE